MCLWWHWTESKTRICTNNTLGQLPFWSFCIECLPEYSQQTSEETRKCSVEYYVENQNLSWNSATKKKNENKKKKVRQFVNIQILWQHYLCGIVIYISQWHWIEIRRTNPKQEDLNQNICIRLNFGNTCVCGSSVSKKPLLLSAYCHSTGSYHVSSSLLLLFMYTAYLYQLSSLTFFCLLSLTLFYEAKKSNKVQIHADNKWNYIRKALHCSKTV